MTNRAPFSPVARRTLALMLFALTAWCAVAETGVEFQGKAGDGPYVLRTAAGWEILSVNTKDVPARRQVRPGDTISVPGVGALPALRVRLRPVAPIAPDKITAPAGAPLFIVADTHGEYEILVELLRKHKVLDDRLAWRFGRGQLVILGDVFDRGPHHLEILWLIYELEAQARKAGGGVHFVLGNHEAMEMRGDLRYTHSRYLHTATVLGVKSYAELFGADTLLGQWLRSKATVLSINGLLCLHGGISREVVERKLSPAQINSAVRAVLNQASFESDADKERAALLMGSNGPLWYRGYFKDQEKFPYATPEDIDRIQQFYGATRILVGHTIVPTITPLYGGKVIAVQVYPHLDEKSGRAVAEGLLVKSGKLFRAKVTGEVEALDGGGQ